MKNGKLGVSAICYPRIRAVLASALIGALGLGTASAVANGRSAALANDFKFFCMRGKPSYESLDAYATALKLQTKKDLSRDMGNGNRVRSKSWIVGDDTGAYELVAGDAVNGNVLVESCGIGSADGAGEEMRADLTAQSDLGTSQESTSPDGRVKTVVWTLSSGEKLILTHATAGPGFYLTLVDKSSRGQ